MNKDKCLKCDGLKWGTYEGIKVCWSCGTPKTKRGEEKLNTLKEFKIERGIYINKLEKRFMGGRNE